MSHFVLSLIRLTWFKFARLILPIWSINPYMILLRFKYFLFILKKIFFFIKRTNKSIPMIAYDWDLSYYTIFNKNWYNNILGSIYRNNLGLIIKDVCI